MHHLFLIAFFALLLFSCENHNFDSDKRQIMAKNAIRSKLPHASKNFDVVAFREDTVATGTDTTIKQALRYTLDYVYTDSAGAVQQKTGTIFFTPDGQSMITATVENPNR